MVNRNLKNIANEIGSNEPPTGIPKRTPSEFLGWEYVPSLKLYVNDEVQFKGESFKYCKDLQKEGISMLSPPQFWQYYDHCKINRPSIIEMLKDRNLNNDDNEYLDALFFSQDKLLVIKPTYENGEPKVSGPMCSFDIKKKGIFNREDIMKNFGYPKKVHRNGEFYLSESFISKSLENRHYPCILTSTPNHKRIALRFIDNNFNVDPRTDTAGGFRSCVTEENIKEIAKKPNGK